ncbi:MAG TPA: hypothetical protein VMT10_06885 [Solirubrobacteraceae bacterium]|nr:hypothetical protein [Solirubrobacteraceae bacterium]
MSRPTRLPVLALAATAVFAAVLALAVGCGSSSPSPSAQVTKVWKQAAGAAVDGQGTTFCALVTDAGKQKITARTQLPCEDSIRLLASRLSAADKAAMHSPKITKVTVSGDNATVTYATTPTLAALGFTGRTLLAKTGGHWMLTGI